MAPSTFASAAAGSNANSARTDTGGDWSRRPNGATQTFRRNPSLSSTSHARDTSASSVSSAMTPGVYVPPHLHPSRNGSSVDSRLSKEQLLDIFKAQKDAEQFGDHVSNLFAEGWAPGLTNGASATVWGRREEAKDHQPGADICWDKNGSSQPLALQEMSAEEKEIFAGSVNSPSKPPNQNQNKDGAKEGLTLRKASISNSQNNQAAYGLASPTGPRPGTRRREPSDAYPFPPGSLASPSASRFPREEPNAVTPPPALVRRRTDFKEGVPEEREKEKVKEGAGENAAPFGSLKRTTTGGPFSAGVNAPASPWATSGSQNAGFSPMGAFGSFALPGGSATPTDKRAAGFGSVRGESRFKGLMNKDSSEDVGRGVKEKASLSSLFKVNESEPGHGAPSGTEARTKRPTGDDLAEEGPISGSAALGGNQESSPPRRPGVPGFGTPSRQDSRDDGGFGAFGMTADNTGLRDIFHSHQTPHKNEPMSPTNTNPYQSPEHERPETEDAETEGSDANSNQLPGLGGFPADPSHGPGAAPFGGLAGLGRVSAAYDAGSNRSATSSVDPTRGFAGLGGLGPLPGLGGSSAWPTGQGSIGTPTRDKLAFSGFGDTFGPNDLQSPNLAGLGGAGMFGPGTAAGGPIGRGGSKLGSLFPTAMQEQMRTGDQTRHSEDGSVEGGDRMSSSAFGRNAFGTAAPGSALPPRDNESPFRAGRNSLDELLSGRPEGFGEGGMNFGPGQSAPGGQGPPPNAPGSLLRNVQGQPNQSQSVSSSASNQPPPVQQRTMVMPDRMRWVYRDPQGNVQGPWSGLEMHDWYKAGFFSPELLVKKNEDPEYEPLAQLIRRIGNSREPFLVPQIGIPYGPPTTQPGNAWGSNLAAAPGSAQPPFANSFPSFGTTLTAEQQNALERRKQEEQWLMARQKEHLAQQQLINKMSGSHGIIPHQLQHHSSAHSLHSQPSFGSITSPGGYQQGANQGPTPGGAPVAGFFDNSFRSPGQAPQLGPIGGGADALGGIREEQQLPGLVDRLSMGRGAQIPFGGAPAPFGHPQQADSNLHEQQVAAMLNDRARLQREQAEHDVSTLQDDHHAAQSAADRLQQFHDLRAQGDEEGAQLAIEGLTGESVQLSEAQGHVEEARREAMATQAAADTALSNLHEPLSLTEQVQKTQSTKQSPAQSPWAKVDTNLPQPFPPPQSQSPLPAPAAQRKQNVADALAMDSRSQSATPSVETPSASIAPWAKEAVEAPKGPSLREIQAAEAKKAAQAEELAAAARRAVLEKELIAQATAAAPAPGLPLTSTWASGASPVTPSASSTPSAWAAKQAAGKVAASTGSKKTLQQIQKEEEARKQRAAAAVAASSPVAGAPPSLSSGKRYADLASKHVAIPPPLTATTGAWTTVGASGKVKTPLTPTAPTIATRSTSNVGAPVLTKPKVAPAQVASRSVTMGSQTGGQPNALDEFKKWAGGELKNHIQQGLNADDIVTSLVDCPPEMDLITEVVHSVSTTIDSRHFAEEFIRRRKLADKGIVDNSNLGGADSKGAGSGGWNEVAKKGGNTAPKEETPTNFKVVAAKKRGGKK